MTVASWEARVESFNDYLLDIANKIEERQYKKSKQAAKVYTIGKFGFFRKITRVSILLPLNQLPSDKIQLIFVPF